MTGPAGRSGESIEAIGCVTYAVDPQGLAWITLNRPHRRNALGDTLREDIVTVFARASAEPAVRAVVLQGAGPSFCAGGDVNELLASATQVGGRSLADRLTPPRERTLLAVAECPKPVIAAVRGAAVGAGMNLALAADVRIAATDAHFSASFVRRGLVPDYGGTYLLPRAVGMAKALELMYTADTVTAADALRLGLVSQVVEPDLLAGAAARLGHRICLGAPVAVQLLKSAVYGSAQGSLRDALERERAAQNVCFDTEDAREGLQAIVDRREPVFVGR